MSTAEVEKKLIHTTLHFTPYLCLGSRNMGLRSKEQAFRQQRRKHNTEICGTPINQAYKLDPRQLPQPLRGEPRVRG